jgi:predicted HTH domain antitoxin
MVLRESTMATIALELTDDEVRLLGGDSEAAGKAVRLAAALFLCSQGRISTALAARLAGLTYADLLKEAERNGVSLFDPDLEDLRQEVARSLPEGTDIEAIKRDLERARPARG